MNRLTIPLLMCVGCATLALADNAATTGTAANPPPDRFKQLDTDGDGKISAAEFAAGRPKNTPSDTSAMFRRMDRDHDGVISSTELHTGRMDRTTPADGTTPGGQRNRPMDGAGGTRGEHPGGDMNHPGVGGPGGMNGSGNMGGPGGMHGPAGSGRRQ